MRKNASCSSNSGAPPKAWIPSSATCRTKFTKSEGPALQGPYFQLRPCVSEIGAQCMLGRGVCPGVSLSLGLCPFPCVLWLLLIGLVLCNDGKRSVLGLLPRVHTSNPNWLGGHRGLSLPRPLPGALVLPHLLRCTILVQEGRPVPSPHQSL